MGSKRSNVASSLKKSVDDRRLSQSSKDVLPRWPSKNDVKTNTITVIVVVLVAAVVLILLDLIFGGAIHLLIGA